MQELVIFVKGGKDNMQLTHLATRKIDYFIC